MSDPAALYRLLGDEARLRLLRLVALERLNVTELTGILGIAQSGVSRHLGLLKDGGLVSEEREAGFTFYGIAPAVRDGVNGHAPLWMLLQDQFERAAQSEIGRADNARLEEIRRLRTENFDAHAGPDAKERQLVPGRSWAAWARALGHLLPPVVVADLGCGEGYLTIEASRWASRVIAVDRSPEVLKRGTRSGDATTRVQHRVETWHARKAAGSRCFCRRRIVVPGTSPCRGSLARDARGGAHSQASRTRPGPGPAGAHGGVGPRPARESSGSGFHRLV